MYQFFKGFDVSKIKKTYMYQKGENDILKAHNQFSLFQKNCNTFLLDEQMFKHHEKHSAEPET